MKKIKTPLKKEEISKLRAGDMVLVSGTLFTARDQAHKRLAEGLQKKRNSPIVLKDTVIYYCGPTKTPKGKVIGSCGPTTSSRMDEFTPVLLGQGVSAMIGKGKRSAEVIQAIKKHKAVYFLTYAGCGALLTKYVKSVKLVAYNELGPEAIYQLNVKDFPLIVAVDVRGRSVWK